MNTSLFEKDLNSMLHDKTILITGGSGTIGTAILNNLLNYSVHSIRIFTNDENSLFESMAKVSTADKKRVRALLGDVRDYKRLLYAMDNVDIVFHTAALKHVEMCEYNPFDCIHTNVIGTQNAIEAALEKNVDRFVLISTDKATSPLNVMGATKLLAEKLITTAINHKGSRKTIFSSVRFGNVLGSRGSLYTIIERQILNGESIQIRDVEMTRFLMSVEKAVDLVLFAAVHAIGGEIFIAKMKTIKIDTLIRKIVDRIITKRNLDKESVNIITTQAVAGEKIHEDLLSPEELAHSLDIGEHYVLIPETTLNIDYSKWKKTGRKINMTHYSSDTAVFFDDEEITELIDLLVERN